MTNALYLHPHGLAERGHDWPVELLLGEHSVRLSLAQAASRLAGDSVCVIFPVELFSCWQTGPWPTRRRPSLQALGYAVEEHLAAPLEQMHWVAGPLDEQRHCAVRACDAASFAAIQAVLREVGVQVASLRLDVDLLSAHPPCVLWLFDRWLLSGVVAAPMALSAAELDSLGDRLPTGLVRLNERDEPAAVAIRLLQSGICGAPELLAAPSRSWRWPVKPLGLAVAAVLCIECALNWSSAWHYRRTAALVESRTVAHLNTLLPEALHSPSVLQQLKALQGRSAPGALTLGQRLQALGDALLGASDLKVRRIEYRADEGWKVHVSAPAIGDIERLRERAVAQQLPLMLLSATQEAGRTVAIMQLEERP